MCLKFFKILVADSSAEVQPWKTFVVGELVLVAPGFLLSRSRVASKLGAGTKTVVANGREWFSSVPSVRPNCLFLVAAFVRKAESPATSVLLSSACGSTDKGRYVSSFQY